MNSGQLAAHRQVLHALIFVLRHQGGNLPARLSDLIQATSGDELPTFGLSAEALGDYEQELDRTLDFLRDLAGRLEQEPK